MKSKSKFGRGNSGGHGYGNGEGGALEGEGEERNTAEKSGKVAIVMSLSVFQNLKWIFYSLLCKLQLGH